jgi:hypothetical protein
MIWSLKYVDFITELKIIERDIGVEGGNLIGEALKTNKTL